MLNQILLYLGALLPLGWGIAHLSPTKAVVAGFGEISIDNRRIITMEWITEGVALIFLGALLQFVGPWGTGRCPSPQANKTALYQDTSSSNEYNKLQLEPTIPRRALRLMIF